MIMKYIVTESQYKLIKEQLEREVVKLPRIKYWTWGQLQNYLNENGNQYLCGKLDEDKLIMKPKFVQGDEYTIKWWKDKAIKRYSKLHEEGRLKPEKLFYADAIGLTWEEMKDKFLADVGR